MSSNHIFKHDTDFYYMTEMTILMTSWSHKRFQFISGLNILKDMLNAERFDFE